MNRFKFSKLSQTRSITGHAKISKVAKIAGIVGALLLVVFVGGKLIFKSNAGSPSAQVAGAAVTHQDLDTSIDIPIDKKSSIKFQLTGADLQNQIILKGQKARAVEGKQFLILTVKLSNSQESRVKINSRDYVRLKAADSDDRLAPNIHNDPIEVQPISDQFTRLGFSVDSSEKHFTLFVGQISEDKTQVDLNFE